MRPTIKNFQRHVVFAMGILFMVSCANIDKVVQKGNYDQAIEIAARKLKGKTKKKQQYVNAIETAFQDANLRDVKRIATLKSQNSISAWEKIYHLAGDIEDRELLVAPLLPILKREGYTINVKWVKSAEIINEAAGELAKRNFDKGEGLLTLAHRGEW